MKTIGLLGGMSWESTAVYYRLLNEAVRDRLGGLHSAEILLHSFDFDQVVTLQRAGDWQGAGRLLGRTAARLEQAGADCVLIGTNTMHLVAEEVASHLSVPLIHIVDETAQALHRAGLRRPLILATRYTMEQGFYTDRLRATGIDPLVPDEDGRATTHAVIFEELCKGIVREQSRQRLENIIARGMEAEADSVILGCTEICLLLDPDRLVCPAIDSTAVHARAAVDFALGDASDRVAA